MASLGTVCATLRNINGNNMALLRSAATLTLQGNLKTKFFPSIHCANPVWLRNISTQPPKRPVSGYLAFAIEKRPGILMDNPGAQFKDVGKITGMMWKSLPEDVKMRYNDASKRDMEEWKENFQRFKHSEEGKQWSMEQARKKTAKVAAKLKKKRLEEAKPKQPSNAFIIFCSDELRHVDPGRGRRPTMFISTAAAKWRNMSAMEKQPYVDRSMAQRMEYQKAMENWEILMVKEGKVDLVRAKSRPKQAPTQKEITAKARKMKARAKSRAGSKAKKSSTKGRKSKATQTEDTAWMREE